ncbi:MAG: ATP-binding cassette domain-containing protein [Phycisphaerales bacterium]|nr:ATP-binding cassette domain-containing protein [Phycisphaerales bacterium]
MPEPAILIEGVTKRFRDKTAVDRLDLEVPTGSLCGFLGPNGAGKTTTIRMVMSIFYPDEGRVSVLGRPSAIESKDRIGYLPEERGVYRKMKVGDFLAYMGQLKGLDAHGMAKRVDDWLARVGLPEVRKKKCEELSKGMQQKVQFVAAIMHDPELIILDEPFSGLDPVNARLMRSLMEDLHRRGKTIIFSTHVLHSAEQLCTRIFMINKGRKVLDGDIDQIRAQYDPKTIVVEPLENGDPRQAQARLASVPGVAGVMHSGAKGVYEVRLIDGADPAPTMAAIITAVPSRRVEVRRATLEDIFVHLVAPGDSEDVLREMLSERGTAAEVNADA